jgi:hypothetical protein
VTTDCGHLLCELTELTERPEPPERSAGSCGLATRRSRGCRPNLASKQIAADVVEEVRALLAVIDLYVPGMRSEQVKRAAVRLAAIVRREALDDRHLLAYARSEEPELAPALERLCVRRR